MRKVFLFTNRPKLTLSVLLGVLMRPAVLTSHVRPCCAVDKVANDSNNINSK